MKPSTGLNRLCAAVASASIAASAAANACCVESFRTTDTIHGLYEIRQEAARFIEQENRSQDEKLQLGDPNLKVLVPRCAVPLTAGWLPKSHGASGHNVAVACSKSVEPGQPKWSVRVPAWKGQKKPSTP